MRPSIVRLKRHAVTQLLGHRRLQRMAIGVGEAGGGIRVKGRGVLYRIERKDSQFGSNVEIATLNRLKLRERVWIVDAAKRIVRVRYRVVIVERWIGAISTQLCNEGVVWRIAVNDAIQTVGLVSDVIEFKNKARSQLLLDAEVPLLYVGDVKIWRDRARKRK